MEKENKKLWRFPWKYRESFIITLILLAIGLTIEFFSNNNGVKVPPYPHNLIILLGIIAGVAIAQKIKNNPFIIWLGSIYASISIISIFTILILTMGFIKQTDAPAEVSIGSKLGFTHIVGSMPYTILSIFLIITLAFTTFRRMFPINLKNFGFFLNHAGLLIMISAASFGVSDIKKYYLSVKEGQTEWQAIDSKGDIMELPLAIKLIDFTLEEYPPNLVLVEKSTGKLVKQEKNAKLPEVKTGSQYTMNQWEVSVVKYFHKAIMKDTCFIEANDTLGAPAAYLSIKDKRNGKQRNAWVCSEGIIQMPMPFELDDHTLLYMANATAKKYKSKVKVYTEDQKIHDAEVEVNKPIKINGWDIYQYGFKSGMSDHENISTFEVVKDPWLPAVFTGIYMMLAGGVFMFWLGNKKSDS